MQLQFHSQDKLNSTQEDLLKKNDKSTNKMNQNKSGRKNSVEKRTDINKANSKNSQQMNSDEEKSENKKPKNKNSESNNKPESDKSQSKKRKIEECSFMTNKEDQRIDDEYIDTIDQQKINTHLKINQINNINLIGCDSLYVKYEFQNSRFWTISGVMDYDKLQQLINTKQFEVEKDENMMILTSTYGYENGTTGLDDIQMDLHQVSRLPLQHTMSRVVSHRNNIYEFDIKPWIKYALHFENCQNSVEALEWVITKFNLNENYNTILFAWSYSNQSYVLYQALNNFIHRSKKHDYNPDV